MNDSDRAGDYLRQLAVLSEQSGEVRELPSVTLRKSANLLDARDDNEPTDPRAIQLATCSNCGATVPARWNPPGD